MYKRCQVYILVPFILLTVPAIAQNYMNIFNCRYFYLPETKQKGDNEEVNFSEWRIETAFPLELKNKNLIGIKPQYKRINLAPENDLAQDLVLNSVKTPVFIYWKLNNPDWSVYADISPKLNSDFKNINNRHFQIGGMFIFYKEKMTGFYWQFGLFYNQDTYGPFIMPLLGLDWKVNSRDYLAVLLPAYVLYEHRIGKQIYTGFEMELTGETYRLGNSQYHNSFISQIGENKLTFLVEPRLFLDYYIAKHWVAYLKPGFRLFQKYEHFTESDQLISNSEYIGNRLKDCFYTEFGIAFRFRYDEADE